MNRFENADFFSGSPIREFVGAGFEKYRPHWKWERNINNASLYYIADGSLEFELQNEAFTVQKSDVVFLKRSDIATISNNTDKYSSLYYIAFNYNDSFEPELPSVTNNTPHLTLFKDILDTHRSGAPYSNLRTSYSLQKLIYNLLIESLHTSKDYILTSRIKSAAEYININYYKNISIDQLCKISGYSPAHLRRLFLKTFGVSPQNYIIERRIEAAKEMLLDLPEKNVDEISDLLGMGSSSYFCKLFKAKTGMSPISFRDNNKK